MHLLNHRFRRPRLLFIGCGDVGERLLPHLVKTHRVFVLTSQVGKMSHFQRQGAIPLLGNLDQPETLRRLATLAPTVIHLAPPNPDGVKDQRTRNLIRILSHGGAVRKFVYVSTTGVYGDCQGAWFSEERTPKPQTTRAKRRLDAENQIRAWGARASVDTLILRVPGIYAENRLPMDRLKQGTPALVPQEDVYTNHIHADDLARLVGLCVYRSFPQRVFNASDSSELMMGEYFDLVAKALNLDLAPRVMRRELITMVEDGRLSPMLLSFMQESRRLKNERLRELGFEFYYPTVADFFSKYA